MMWNGQDIDLDAYFARIGYDGDASPTLKTLGELHRAHVAAIPFENLDVALGRPVPLDVKSLAGKLVAQARGGYCYEQNSLFAAVLERLGFEFGGRGARNRTRGAWLPPVTQVLLAVTVEGQLPLCDAGFGGQGPLEPVPPDFTVMDHYSSSHPQSRFVGQVVAQRTAPGMRRALVRDEFTTVRTDGTEERSTVPAGELGRVLSEVFDIVMEREELAQLGALGGGLNGR
ncbi:arylamine N-acetyltransferase family protein [Streptomyces sp. WM6378]|uniref:arylamine N-acetyltransferase family protein n=1 Tax=Streptomyces sp. WM6378 TaxID=1415557 RepID=UPI0006AD9405|nr:arylamine N-acetyltransferase [Streptomyces sp. WM6378]